MNNVDHESIDTSEDSEVPGLLPPGFPCERTLQRAYELMGLDHRGRPMAALTVAVHDLELTTHHLACTITRLAGGDARVQLLQDSYIFVNGAQLRTYVLRISGTTSGQVVQVHTPRDHCA